MNVVAFGRKGRGNDSSDHRSLFQSAAALLKYNKFIVYPIKHEIKFCSFIITHRNACTLYAWILTVPSFVVNFLSFWTAYYIVGTISAYWFLFPAGELTYHVDVLSE